MYGLGPGRPNSGTIMPPVEASGAKRRPLKRREAPPIEAARSAAGFEALRADGLTKQEPTETRGYKSRHGKARC